MAFSTLRRRVISAGGYADDSAEGTEEKPDFYDTLHTGSVSEFPAV
jgi:hypothetical protein